MACKDKCIQLQLPKVMTMKKIYHIGINAHKCNACQVIIPNEMTLRKHWCPCCGRRLSNHRKTSYKTKIDRETTIVRL